MWISFLFILTFQDKKVFSYFNLNYLKNSFKIYGSFRSNNFISSETKQRLEKGTLTPRELDKLFTPSKAESDGFLKISSTGFAGVIFSLDSVLVDLKQIYGYSYALLAGELGQTTPNPKKVYDSIGSSFRTTTISFGWDIDVELSDKYEMKFHEIFTKLLDIVPFSALPGVSNLINELIRNKDELTVISSLPRSITIKILKKSNLSPLFEGRVPAEHLICRDEMFDGADSQRYSKDTSRLHEEKYSGSRLIQCCGFMRSPTMLSVYIDGNRRNILSAKRVGLGVIALQGYAENPMELKSADKLISSMDMLSSAAIYKLIRERLIHAEGPGQQTAASVVREGGGYGRKLVASPVEDESPNNANDSLVKS